MGMENNCPFILPSDHEVVGYRPIIDAGGYQKGEIFILGAKTKPEPFNNAEVVDGWWGKETKIVAEGIIPIRIIEIVDSKNGSKY